MISLEWVSDYIDISDQDLKELALKITSAGINVEKVISNKIDNLVVGEVVDCVSHPDSDHLHVCTVSTGKDEIQIVCGAPNVRVGIKVIVALPGAILPGDLKIKKSKIRGVNSNGMICALFEIGLEEKTDENYKKGIEILPDNLTIGDDPLKALGLEDTLYELDIHKHRNNDCYYHIGFAYEIAAILNRKVNLPKNDFKEIKDNIKDHFQLRVDTDKCPYYLARMVTDVKVGKSPDFIKRRLESYGMRSINNVVDISNYVMLEYGQPLHFFDKDKLGDKIVVRDAFNQECIRTLDGIDRVLTENDIVISDGDKAVCVAGVMGGENTEVDENTTSILIESAIFDSVSIRYTANNLNLRSEASIRYGKGLSYEYTDMAMERACYLLCKYAGAKVLSGVVKHDNICKTPVKVSFKSSEINKLLGITISEDDVKFELERLGFEYTYKDGVFDIIIPPRRLDIDPNVNDIAEEIGRLYGYHNLIETLPVVSIRKGEYVGDVKYRKIISKRLRALGLNESRTHTLISPKMSEMFNYFNKSKAVLPNPMSNEKSVVRTTLIPSLLNVYDYNKAHKVKDVMIYEISKTYDGNYNEESLVSFLMKGSYVVNSWNGIDVKTDFYLIKGIVENLLNYLGFADRYCFEKAILPDIHPGISAKILLDGKMVGIIGKVHPKVNSDDIYVAELSLNSLMSKVKPIRYESASKYPNIVKDMAFVVDKDVTSDQIESIIKKTGGKLLTDIKVFDVYDMGDKKSIAYSLTFNGLDKTLTDDEVIVLFEKIIAKVTGSIDAKLRDN